MSNTSSEIYAHEIDDPNLRAAIAQQYQTRWKPPEATPETHPWNYDPLNPPPGWRYDPCYELWISN